LIEIMVALVVIAVGLIAIVGLIPQGIQSSRDASDNTIAASIAHDTFNVVRRLALVPPWPPLTPPTTVHYYYDVAATNPVTAPNAYYDIQVTPQLSASQPNLMVVTAAVRWPAKSASPNSLVFVTEIANYQQ
jgi:type II secretory pathway pseudopilin PulG